jgi:anti-sigma B factor antagonist
MQIEKSERDGIAVLAASGRFDLVSAPQMKATVDELVASGQPRIIVDLSGVELIDSSGLGALVGSLKTTRQAGGDLRIAAPGEQVRAVLSLTHLDHIFRAYAGAEDALRGW